jgi:hypothetical protein
MVVHAVGRGESVAAAPAAGAAIIPAHATEGAVMFGAGMAAAADFLVVDAACEPVLHRFHAFAFWSSVTSRIDCIIFCQFGTDWDPPPDSSRKYATHSRNSE